MKLLLPLGLLMFVLSFCGITDMVKDAGKESGEKPDAEKSESGDDKKADAADEDVKEAKLTSDMEAKLDGDKLVWEEQGIEFKLPKGWPKIMQNKTMINYGTPANGFLIANISSMPSSFTPETREISLKATYDQQVQKAKEGGNELVQWTMINGVKGVEWVEAMPEDKSDARRHQFIGYREFNDQIQMLNIMVSTQGSNFDSKKDVFNAVLYSMTIAKQ